MAMAKAKGEAKGKGKGKGKRRSKRKRQAHHGMASHGIAWTIITEPIIQCPGIGRDRIAE